MMRGHSDTGGRNNPLFSVVIPVYNRAATILPTLESVRSQTYENFECIVVDDGSSDADQLVEVLSLLNDARFRYIRRPNGGGGAARNTGVEAALGTYICFLDSDDRFVAEKLAVVANLVTNDPNVAYYSQTLVDRGVGTYWVRPTRGIRDNEDVGEYVFVGNHFIQTSAIVLHRDTALRVPFDPALRKCQDLDLCVRLQAAGVRFEMITPALTVWYDVSEEHRTSRSRGFEAELEWLKQSRTRGYLTDKAVRGFRATILAYHMGWRRPLTVAAYLTDGLVRGGVSARVIGRQVLRCYLPRGYYRKVVDWWVGRFGEKKAVAPSAA